MLPLLVSIENDRLIVTRGPHDAFPYTVKSVADFHQYLQHEAKHTFGVKPEDMPVYVSSTLDFPEEATTNADTIALAKALRG